MKKVYLFFFAMLFVAFQLQASTSISDNVADFDETEIYTAFNEIDELVAVVNSSDATYASLMVEKSNLLENVSASAAIATGMMGADAPPMISAFWWGCLFSVLGIVVVAVTTDSDKAQIRSSVKGCVFNALAYVVVYVVYIVAIGSLFASAAGGL